MEKVEVTLTGPAKIDGRWRKPGETIPVSETVRDHLREAKVIHCNLDDVIQDVKGSGDIRSEIALELGRRAVAQAVAERDANWSTALDHFQTMAEDERDDAIAALKAAHFADVQALQKRVTDAETEAGDLRAKVAELEAKATDTQSAKGATKKA